ncbi:hypothetical protein [Flavisolibacter tropicus]|uniref:hypothetical protein n=1 Tax=Flavisolibacter tropicus TaxID=1492898 RepID=UPI0008363C60|nr:hypothetical protein [Flavisolibacter tropicus]
MKGLLFAFASLYFICCSREATLDGAEAKKLGDTPVQSTAKGKGGGIPTAPTTFAKYTIQQGAHECDPRTLKSVSGTSMNFVARFDSTAIYPAVITDYNHAYDANKLWGFSEGLNNQYNSARLGWRWLNGKLELLAYVYVKGTLLRDPISYDPPFIKAVEIGRDINCSIAVSGSSYVFTVDGVAVKTARGRSVSTFSGYQQYPYFGGTLTAPHLMNFYIK